MAVAEGIRLAHIADTAAAAGDTMSESPRWQLQADFNHFRELLDAKPTSDLLDRLGLVVVFKASIAARNLEVIKSG